MGLTAPPSLSNALPATPAASPAWTARSSPRCPCLRQNRPDPPSAPNMRGAREVTAPPARPTTRPSTSAPPTRCTTAASASPTCPLTTRTRLWPCRCPPCTAPCWGTPREADLWISTPTPEPSAPRCNSVHADLPALRRKQRSDGVGEAQLMETHSSVLWGGSKRVCDWNYFWSLFYFHIVWGHSSSRLMCSCLRLACSCSSKPCKCQLLLCLYSARIVVLWVSC